MRNFTRWIALALTLPACGGEKNTSATDPTTDTTDTTDTTTDTTGTTDPTTGTTDTTTGTGTTTGTTEPTTTTGEPTTGEPATTTTSEPETTGAPPLLGDPGSYGESCAPDDGPAVELRLQLSDRTCAADWPEDQPIVRIVLFEGVQLDLGEHPLDGGWGFAWLDVGDGMPVTGDVGTVTITEITADGLRGSYDITLDDNSPLVGAFDLIYCPVDVLCG